MQTRPGARMSWMLATVSSARHGLATASLSHTAAARKWSSADTPATQRCAGLLHDPKDAVDVSDDERALSVNGVTVQLPDRLRTALIWPDGVVVAVYPYLTSASRNLYRYNLDGSLKWQVGERAFQRGVPFTDAVRVSDAVLSAQGWHANPESGLNEGVGALVDYETGIVVAREEPR